MGPQSFGFCFRHLDQTSRPTPATKLDMTIDYTRLTKWWQSCSQGR